MSSPTLTARRSSRHSVAKLGQTSLFEPKQTVVEPIAEVLPATLYEQLVKRNPHLAALTEALDLIEVSSRRLPIIPTPYPELILPVVIGPVSPKLKQLAEQIFEPNKTYTRDQAAALLATVTNVTPDRAQNGLSMMQQQNLIALTGSDEFYLATSTPF